MAKPDENDVVGLIYEAGLAPTRWTEAMEALRQALDSRAATMMMRDGLLGPSADLFALAGGTLEDFMPYGNYYRARDLRWDFARLRPVGELYTEFKELPHPHFMQSEIFTDYFRPLGMDRSAGVKLLEDRNRFCSFSTHLQPGREFKLEELAMLRRLSAHMARALRVQRQIGLAQEAAGTARLAFDHLPNATFVIETNGKVRDMNGAARAMLQTHSKALRLTAAGRLSAVQSGADAALVQAMAAVFARQSSSAPAPICRIETPSGVLALMVVPAGNFPFAIGAEPAALVFVADHHRPVRLDATQLASEHGLTAAEARIGAELAMGNGVVGIAASLKISPETVYTHIKRILAKTGSKNQAQLVAKMLRGVSATSRIGATERR